MKTSNFILIVFICLLLGVNAKLITNHNHLRRNFVTPIENAAIANDSALVVENLNQSIIYLERYGLTDGFTSAVFYSKEDDLKFYYKELVSARNNISSGNLKLPETIYNYNFRSVQYPDGLESYPYNLWFGIFKIIDVALVVILFGILFAL